MSVAEILAGQYGKAIPNLPKIRRLQRLPQARVFELLVNRNINVDGHRTSIRLEPEFWARLADIAEREYLTIDELCTEIDSGAGDLSRTAAVRVFITSYMVRLAQLAAEQQSQPVSGADEQRFRVAS